MDQKKPAREAEVHPSRWDKPARWSVHFFQALFLAVALIGLDGPFVSAHNERQNQTFDMARHVFHDGWRSVLTPKVSYFFLDNASKPYTAVLQEVPFHGLIGWPLMLVTTHERAVVRLVSTAFGLLSIQLIYLIIRCWLPPPASAAGAALWATAPLVLHFGQVPMPDIVCTTGMLASFWFALRNKLPASSAWFLFAILAKLNVIVFGLPILVALVVNRDCQTFRGILRTALGWGWLPLAGLLACGIVLWAFARDTNFTVVQLLAERGHWSTLFRLTYYKFILGCLVPFGFGILGLVGLIFAIRERTFQMNPWIKRAIIAANLVYFVFVLRKVAEPQYLLPPLAWLIIAAAFGFNHLMGKLNSGVAWRIALGAAVIVQLIVAVLFAVDLKSSRVPDYADIERAAKPLPPGARIIAAYRNYGASPAVWLNRDVIAVGVPGSLDDWHKLRPIGFTYFILLDIESWHDKKTSDGPFAFVTRLFSALREKTPSNAGELPNFAGPASPFRQYCDQRFTLLFESPHVVLYSIPDPGVSK